MAKFTRSRGAGVETASRACVREHDISYVLVRMATEMQASSLEMHAGDGAGTSPVTHHPASTHVTRVFREGSQHTLFRPASISSRKRAQGRGSKVRVERCGKRASVPGAVPTLVIGSVRMRSRKQTAKANHLR